MPDIRAFSFSLPTRVRFGVGELRALAEEARALRIRRPLLVTDSFLVGTTQLRGAVEDCRAAGVAVEVWDGVVPNPTDTSVHEGWARYRSAGCDGLIPSFFKTFLFSWSQSHPHNQRYISILWLGLPPNPAHSNVS